MFSERSLNLEEREIREQVRALSPAQQQRYAVLEQRRLKLPHIYLWLNTALPLGLHHFYLGRWLRGLCNLSISLFAIVLILNGQHIVFGVMLLIAVALVDIPQLMNARHLVHSRNNHIMANCLAQILQERQETPPGPEDGLKTDS